MSFSDDGEFNEAEWRANARLMAAAPELLAACKLARRHISSASLSADIVDAAIAKAESAPTPQPGGGES
jgi:hypothetical protein